MIHKAVTLRASSATTTGAQSVSETAVELGARFTEMVAVLDVTAAAADVGDTLDVYLDTSFDGGTTWINIGHFTQVLGNGGVKKFLMSFKSNPIAASNAVPVGTDQAAGAALQIGFGSKLRCRYVQVDANSNGAFTFSLKAFLKA